MKINETYTKKEVMNEMQEHFTTNGFIQLTNFFEKLPKDLEKIISKEKFKTIYKPLEIKKQILEKKETFNLDILKLFEFFKSTQFRNFIEELTNFEITIKNIELNKYKHEDFKILIDNIKREECIEILFDLSKGFKEDMGGLLTYTTREEEILYIDPNYNTITILYKPEELMKYLKYLNNKCKKKEIIRFEIQFEIEE